MIEERLLEQSDAILASELAYHWQEADEPERALPASITAGLAAEAAGARNEAAVQFERALVLLDKLYDPPEDLPLDRVALLERAAANLQASPQEPWTTSRVHSASLLPTRTRRGRARCAPPSVATSGRTGTRKPHWQPVARPCASCQRTHPASLGLGSRPGSDRS